MAELGSEYDRIRPLIGVTADWTEQDGGSPESEYVLRCNYASAIQSAGGVPIIIPYAPESIDVLIDRLDGIVFSGGMFDIHPRHYGMPEEADNLSTKEAGTAFELDLLDAALQARKCILGICNGMQLLAVKLGGQLHRDIGAEINGAIEHLPFRPPTRTAHKVAVARDSKLFSIMEKTMVPVNSLHHQSVVESLVVRVSARCIEDGVVEAIESDQTPFCIGVQWHPEYELSTTDKALWFAFVASASQAHAFQSGR
jgi:putative glutamine amidotransferase